MQTPEASGHSAQRKFATPVSSHIAWIYDLYRRKYNELEFTFSQGTKTFLLDYLDSHNMTHAVDTRGKLRLEGGNQHSRKALTWPTRSGQAASAFFCHSLSPSCSRTLSFGPSPGPPLLVIFSQAVSFVLTGLATAHDLASSLILQTGEVSLSSVPIALAALPEGGVAQWLA